MLKLSLLSNSTCLTGTLSRKSPILIERLNNAVERGKGQRSYYREVREGKGIIVDEGHVYDADGFKTRYAQKMRDYATHYGLAHVPELEGELVKVKP